MVVVHNRWLPWSMIGIGSAWRNATIRWGTVPSEKMNSSRTSISRSDDDGFSWRFLRVSFITCTCTYIHVRSAPQNTMLWINTNVVGLFSLGGSPWLNEIICDDFWHVIISSKILCFVAITKRVSTGLIYSSGGWWQVDTHTHHDIFTIGNVCIHCGCCRRRHYNDDGHVVVVVVVGRCLYHRNHSATTCGTILHQHPNLSVGWNLTRITRG